MRDCNLYPTHFDLKSDGLIRIFFPDIYSWYAAKNQGINSPFNYVQSLKKKKRLWVMKPKHGFTFLAKTRKKSMLSRRDQLLRPFEKSKLAYLGKICSKVFPNCQGKSHPIHNNYRTDQFGLFKRSQELRSSREHPLYYTDSCKSSLKK